MLMSRSGAERLRMGLGMFDSARKLCLAGTKAQNPGASEPELKRKLFARFYGDLFPGPQLEKMLKGME